MKKWIKRAAAALGIAFAVWLTVGMIVEMVTNPRLAYGDFRYRVIANGTAVQLVRYNGGREGGLLNRRSPSVQIPSHIGGLPLTRIEVYTFTRISGRTRRGFSIETVSIPGTVTYIGYGAFTQNLLTSVSIPAGVRTISRRAFSTNRISSLDLPGTLVYVNGFNVNNLTSLDIPYGVRYIGNWAFRMNQLTSVSIPDSVLDIGSQAFRHNQLTEVSVPQHTRVANNAFDSDVTVIRRLYSKTELQP